MEAPQLGIDPEEFVLDIVPGIEQSFGIQFATDDFPKGFTYGELCELVHRKLPVASAEDCTTQQSFYKLRRALRPLVGAVSIRPATRLADLLPADPRPVAANLDAVLQMELKLVTMPLWAETLGSVLLMMFLGMLVVAPLAALVGGKAIGVPAATLAGGCLGLAILVFAFGARIGKRLVYETVGELAEHMASRYYRQSRRHSDTVNPREVKARLDHLFVNMNGLEANQLVPEAVL